jgi:hypothetical protein
MQCLDYAAPILLAVALLLPPLAMIGAHHGAGEVIQLAKQPEWRTQNLQTLPPAQYRGRRRQPLVFSNRLCRGDEPMMVRIAADPIVLASLVLQAPHVAKPQASVAPASA